MVTLSIIWILVVLVVAALIVLLAPGKIVEVGAKIGGLSFLIYLVVQIAKFLIAGG